MSKTKILIAGIGGVGGYFGGLLAKYFYGNEHIEINFLARGSHLKAIQNNGLKIIKGHATFIAKPTLATGNPIEIGISDFILLTTKSYDLDHLIRQLQPCINKNTIFLPLLNGVDAQERIKNIYPNNIVLEGCAYIVSRLTQAGTIENTGNIQTLYFGLDNFTNDRLRLLENILKEAGIEAHLSDNISTIVWEKFISISPTATATSYFDKCIGELLANSETLAATTSLIEEVKQIAHAKQVFVPHNITGKTLNKLKALPFETTSSMHSDFQNKKPNNELKSLTEYVIVEGRKHHIATPVYSKMYAALIKKTG